MIFKSPTESNNCGLGGSLTFIARAAEAPLRSPIRFIYTHMDSRDRNDVLSIGTKSSTLSIRGRGQYRFGAAAASSLWLRLPATDVQLGDRSEITFLIARQRAGGFRLEAFADDRARRRELFSGSVLPVDGIVYLRGALLPSAKMSYAGTSQHNCGNWNTAGTAASALARVEAHWPR